MLKLAKFIQIKVQNLWPVSVSSEYSEHHKQNSNNNLNFSIFAWLSDIYMYWVKHLYNTYLPLSARIMFSPVENNGKVSMMPFVYFSQERHLRIPGWSLSLFGSACN